MSFEIGAGFGVAKLAPILFLSVNQRGEINVNFVQIVQTLVVSGIVATVTMYGTQRVLETQMANLVDSHNRLAVHIERLDTRVDELQTRQATTIAERVANQKALSDRLLEVERKLGRRG